MRMVHCDEDSTHRVQLDQAKNDKGFTPVSVMIDIIKSIQKEDAAKNGRATSRGRSATERVTDADIEVMIEIPTVKPATQVAVKSRANTDRCFLMIDNVKHSVKSCNLETAKGGKANAGGRGA